MPKKSKSEQFRCEFFVWKLFLRDGIFYADGRGAGQRLGKHTLETRDRAVAIATLRQLDRQKAIDRGIAEPLKDVQAADLAIATGWEKYLADREGPGVLRGLSPNSLPRYKQARNKHLLFCKAQGTQSWSDVTEEHITQYGRWLHRRKHAERGAYLLMVIVLAVHRWLIRKKYLPTSARFSVELDRPDGTETYCYQREEVAAMIGHCQKTIGLEWLGRIVFVLACTGLRISELIGLRWSDVDLMGGMIVLTDERASRRRQALGTARRIKGKRTRRIPISQQLRELLSGLPRNADGRLLHDQADRPLVAYRVREALIRDVIEPLSKQFSTPPGEVGFEHGRLHSLRHFFVSESFRQGATESEIMSWTGHRDAKLVALYRHLRDDDGLSRMAKIQFIVETSGVDSAVTAS